MIECVRRTVQDKEKEKEEAKVEKTYLTNLTFNSSQMLGKKLYKLQQLLCMI